LRLQRAHSSAGSGSSFERRHCRPRQRAGACTIVVDERNDRKLTEAFARLAADVLYWVELGAAAQAVGSWIFNAARATELFVHHLRVSAASTAHREMEKSDGLG
jgi:hypothetical protein